MMLADISVAVKNPGIQRRNVNFRGQLNGQRRPRSSSSWIDFLWKKGPRAL